MKSRATPRFWAAYRGLPVEVRDAAQKAYRLFRENPQHPSLQFKKVHDHEPIYSCGSHSAPVLSDFVSMTRSSGSGLAAIPSTTAS